MPAFCFLLVLLPSALDELDLVDLATLVLLVSAGFELLAAKVVFALTANNPKLTANADTNVSIFLEYFKIFPPD